MLDFSWLALAMTRPTTAFADPLTALRTRAGIILPRRSGKFVNFRALGPRIAALLVMLAALVLAAAAPARAQASAPDWASEELRLWVAARAGTGAPVHWLAEGGVYDYPTGKKLFGMIGFDSSRVIWPAEPGEPVVHLTRKVFAYTHPDSGEILTEWQGQKVDPIAYPYQIIRYREVDGKIYGDVEQGAGKAVQVIKSADGMRLRWMGRDTLAVTAPVFLNFPLPGGGQYEAWENYDFFLHRAGTTAEPHQMAWQRYGAPPPFAEGAPGRKAIYHLLSWRVESTAEFPPALLAWAKAKMPGWLVPPADMAEVRALQAGQPMAGWAQ
jgi:hypothetical protein